MQTALFRFWILVAKSTSYNDNHYTQVSSEFKKKKKESNR